MSTCRAFIISTSPLFVDAISHLLAEAGAEVVAQTKELVEAQSILNHHTVNAIIVDSNDIQLPEIEVVARLMGNGGNQQVVFLTMAGNEMVIYHREKLENVTPQDLVKTICITESRPVS